MKSILLGLFIGLFLMSAWAEDSREGDTVHKDLQFIGYAYDLNNNDLLYSEHHTIRFDQDGNRETCSVMYYDPAGNLIADKTLRYDESGYLPNFVFKDHRSNQGIEVLKQDDAINIQQKMVDERLTDSVDYPKGKDLIADAGFDVFMNKNWQALVNGEAKEVEFLAVTRGRFVTFSIERTRIYKNRVYFRLAPANFLISMLVDPIELEYDRASGKILSYVGLTNLEWVEDGQPKGENYVARIEYVYETVYGQGPKQ